MSNHPNRSRRAKRAEPELGWTYGQFLPEITDQPGTLSLLISKMRQARILEAQLRELRREIHQDIAAQWSIEEIEQAKQAVHDDYERATGRRLGLDPRMC